MDTVVHGSGKWLGGTEDLGLGSDPPMLVERGALACLRMGFVH